MLYELEPISFAILVTPTGQNLYFYQEVADAHRIVSDNVPHALSLVVHKCATLQGDPSDTYRVSDKETGAKICSDDSYDRDKAVENALAFLQRVSEQDVIRQRQRIKQYKRQAKRGRRKKIKYD